MGQFFLITVLLIILIGTRWTNYCQLRSHTLEKGMATHSRILAWKTPWAEEPGRLQSMGLQRVELD